VIFFDLQRGLWSKASNDWGVRQHPATAADRVSLRWLADYRNADGCASLRSTPTTAAAAAATTCGRISVRQHPGSAASGWGIVWKYSAAWTVNWRNVWKHHYPAAACSRWILCLGALQLNRPRVAECLAHNSPLNNSREDRFLAARNNSLSSRKSSLFGSTQQPATGQTPSLFGTTAAAAAAAAS
jgi:hypothetical protein